MIYTTMITTQIHAYNRCVCSNSTHPNGDYDNKDIQNKTKNGNFEENGHISSSPSPLPPSHIPTPRSLSPLQVKRWEQMVPPLAKRTDEELTQYFCGVSFCYLAFSEIEPYHRYHCRYHYYCYHEHLHHCHHPHCHHHCLFRR